MPKRLPWDRAGEEPSIGDLLSDPAGQTLLRADGVTAAEVASIISWVVSRRPPSSAKSAPAEAIPLADPGARAALAKSRRGVHQQAERRESAVAPSVVSARLRTFPR